MRKPGLPAGFFCLPIYEPPEKIPFLEKSLLFIDFCGIPELRDDLLYFF